MFSCSKSDNEESIDNKKNNIYKLIEVTNKKIDVDWEEYTKYNYKNGELSEIEYSTKGSDYYNYKKEFQYETNNTVNVYHHNSNGKIVYVDTYYIVNERIVQLDSRKYSQTVIKDYIYDGKNVNEIKLYNRDLNITEGNIKYEYDYRDNPITIKYNFSSETETFYTYDNYKNPYSLVYNAAFQKANVISTNNKISEFTIHSINNRYEYKYNEQGYPTEVKVYEDDVYKYLTTFKYSF